MSIVESSPSLTTRTSPSPRGSSPGRSGLTSTPIYAFCRFVDDLGDESPGDRLSLLDWWENELRSCYSSTPSHPIAVALRETVHRFEIPQEPFLKLVEANRMDQRASRHRTYEDLLYYCERSANPVGHLFL